LSECKNTRIAVYLVIAIIFWLTWIGMRIGQSEASRLLIGISVSPILAWLIITNFNQFKRSLFYNYIFIFVAFSALLTGFISGYSATIFINFFISVALYLIMNRACIAKHCKRSYAILIALPILLDILYFALTGGHYKSLLIGSSYSHISGVLLYLLVFIVLFYENCKKDTVLTILSMFLIIFAALWSGSRSSYFVVLMATLFVFKILLRDYGNVRSLVLVVLAVLLAYSLIGNIHQESEVSKVYSFSLAKFYISDSYLDGTRYAIFHDFFSRGLGAILIPNIDYQPLMIEGLSVHNSFLKVIGISGILGIVYILMLFVRFVFLRKTIIFFGLSVTISSMLFFNDIGFLNSKFDFLLYLVFLSPYYGICKFKKR
jgi:hypothetical protein